MTRFEVTRQCLWFDSDFTRPIHDSTRKLFRWFWLDFDSKGLWLDKYDSGTAKVSWVGRVKVLLELRCHLSTAKVPCSYVQQARKQAPRHIGSEFFAVKTLYFVPVTS